jgi:hypothetical protein
MEKNLTSFPICHITLPTELIICNIYIQTLISVELHFCKNYSLINTIHLSPVGGTFRKAI